MTKLVPFEQILAEGLDPAYVIFASPEWLHFHPTELPAPIADWINRYTPEVEIRRIASFPSPKSAYVSLVQEQHNEFTAALEEAPAFVIGFNAEQAAAFEAAWLKPDGSPSDAPEFYFCDLTCNEDADDRPYDGQAIYRLPDPPKVAVTD